jgi:signal transduction histidine kinase
MAFTLFLSAALCVILSITAIRLKRRLEKSMAANTELRRDLHKNQKYGTEMLEKASQTVKLQHAQIIQSEKMASLGALAAGVAHEINNPVGFISSNLGTLADYVSGLVRLMEEYRSLEPEANPQARARIDQIKKEIGLDYILQDIETLVKESIEGSERIRRIVADLKEFSHADDETKKYVDLNKGIESTISIAWNELKYKAEVIRDFGQLPQLFCYPQKLNQVFLNLLVNAAQAIPQKGRIIVKTRQQDGCVVAEVRDTGSGIPPENLSRLFAPFFTTKPVGKGTGLGLHIAYKIVKEHGGKIEVESRLGEGTCFRVFLPLTKEAYDGKSQSALRG